MMSLTVGVCLRNAILKKVIISCIIYSTYALSLTVENSCDGSDTFIICNSVTMTCKHQSYSGVNVWIFGSENIAECLFSVCEIKVSKSGFTFKFDTQTGIFTLTIDQVKTEHMNKVIECHNGSTTASFTSKSNDKGEKSRTYTIIVAVIMGIDLIFFAVVYVLFLILHRKKVESEGNNTTDKENQQIIRAVLCYHKHEKDRRGYAFVFWGASAIGIIVTFILVIVTRFKRDSVIENVDGLCCWGILLSIEGVLVFVFVVLMVIRIIVFCRCPKDVAIKNSLGSEMKTGEEIRPDLPLVNMNIKTDNRIIDICFRSATYNPDVLTTVCFYTDGKVAELTEGQYTTESNEFPWSGKLYPMATHFQFPSWIKNKQATCKKLEPLGRCHFNVKISSKKTLFTVFVFWTTKEHKILANSRDTDFTKDINTMKEFNTEIRPEL